MINTNNTQVIPTTTGTKSESTIYLKKSELPKNVSSFKNDIGYISSNTLDIWLKNHSYLSKSEVEALIKSANLVVLDTVKKSTESEAINRLDKCISDIRGEIVEIKDKLTKLGADKGFVTLDKLPSLATKSDITIIGNKINTMSSSISQMDDKLSKIDINKIALKKDIPTVPTKVSELVNDKGYITSHQPLTDYVKKSDLVTSLNKYELKGTSYTKNEVDDLISPLATKENVEKYYMSKSDAKKSYITQKDAATTYLTIEDYRGIKDATVINDTYKSKTYEDIRKDVATLMSGFYIVNGSDIVVIKEHSIINVFKDGERQFIWREETD